MAQMLLSPIAGTGIRWEHEMNKPQRESALGKANTVDDKELLEAIMLSEVQYRGACRRFNARVRTSGFDRTCSKLLDQIALRRSLLRLLAGEARRQAMTA